jgi:thiazole/oxazole-forming peptide maturase SagD family component
VAQRGKLGPVFYPYGTHLLENVLKPICSEHGGITQSLLMSPIKYSDGLDIRSVMAQMPPYHKQLLSPDLDIQYHLSGYGTFYEEAIIRLVGEAIERYSLLVVPSVVAEKVRYASWNEISRSGKVVPLEYLRLFSDEDYARLNRGRYRGLRRLEADDIVGWLQCTSLFDPGIEIWTPAQMLFVGYPINRAAGEVAFCPGFSTGTAAHSTVEKALQNAMLEFIEIDALMLRWYTQMPAPLVAIDNLNVAALAPKLLGADSQYEVLGTDLRVLKGVDAHVFGVTIINKLRESPYITLGAQGSLNPVSAFYRGLMETVAISFLGIYGPLYMPREYLWEKGSGFTDLDTNVAFFASPENAEMKRGIIEKLISGKSVLSGMKSYETGDVAADTARLAKQLSSVSEYGVYLDVTAPETRSRGWKVMRVFFPELVSMCVPGVPYSEHPRIKAHGGIRNEYPHPLP